MGKRRPRVNAEDRIPDGERAEIGSWVRWNGGHSEGHFLFDGRNALCGRFIPTYAEPWVEWFLTHVYDGEEFWRAYDRRKGSKCSQCKTRSKGWERPEEPEMTEKTSTWPSSRKAQAEQLKLRQQAAWVAAMLDGEVVDAA